MSKSTQNDTKKKTGRPATGIGKQINVRLHPKLLDRLDAYRGDMSRPKAIRELIEKALNEKI
ncbi:MAG: hypothetical protein V3U57_00310 [Robiginitomaculum sp.]